MYFPTGSFVFSTPENTALAGSGGDLGFVNRNNKALYLGTMRLGQVLLGVCEFGTCVASDKIEGAAYPSRIF